MLVEELKTGDLIFELDSLGSIEHVSIYAGIRQGLHYQVHATLGRHYRSIMITYLRQNKYAIFRPQNNDLALLATGIMYRWVEFQVPFASEEKRSQLLRSLDRLKLQKMSKLSVDISREQREQEEHIIEEDFGKSEYGTRSIQLYINMLKALPFVPVTEGDSTSMPMGLFCSEAIIAAYNIAMMISHEELFRQINEAPEGLPVTAILEDMIRKLDNPLPFDASSTYPGGMYKHCLENASHWENLGILNHQEVLEEDLAAQRDDWLEFRRLLLEDAPALVEKYMRLERAVTPIDALLESENQNDSPIPRHRSPQHLLLWSHLDAIPRSSPVHFLGQSEVGSPHPSSPKNLLLWGNPKEIPRSGSFQVVCVQPATRAAGEELPSNSEKIGLQPF